VVNGRIEIDGIAFLEEVPVRTYDDLSALGHDTDATYRHRRRTRLPGRCPRRAWFEPRGLGGELYWGLLYPIHVLIFRGMVRAIARKAESSFQSSAEAFQGS
jgi:hypothetical protein